MPTITREKPEQSEPVRAADKRSLDIAYGSLESPFGSILIASTERGLISIGLPEQDPDRIFDELSARLSAQFLERPDQLDEPRRQLTEYFEGSRRQFELTLDLSLAGGFQARALNAIAAVPYGQTATYTEVATAAGSPRAYRAAGTTCARNPIPIVIPCHRILATGGGLGGYGGGLEMKQALLAMEGADTGN